MFFFDVFFLFILLYFTETITPLPETTTTVVLPTTMTVTTTTAIADTIPNGLIDTVVCKIVHKFASVWCKTALREVGVSLP